MAFESTWNTLNKSLMLGIEVKNDTQEFYSATTKGLRQNAWNALFTKSTRPVLIPTAHPAGQKSGLEFFIANPFRLRCAKALLSLHQYFPKLFKVPRVLLSSTKDHTLIDELELPDAACIAFSIDMPNPCQKSSVLIMSKEGRPLALAKVALSENADLMIQTETEWLAALGNEETLRDHVPRVLKYGKSSNGRSYSVLSTAPMQYTKTTDFTLLHAIFLRRLGKASFNIKKFTSSHDYHFLQKTLANLKPSLSLNHFGILSNAFNDAKNILGDWQGPYVVSHGDFAPWNLHLYPQKLFVFDWKHAQEDASALRDYFHYLLIQLAVSGRGRSYEPMKFAIGRAREFLTDTYPETNWNYKVLRAHGLLYLLHTVLSRINSVGSVVESDATVKYYFQLIKDRKSWM